MTSGETPASFSDRHVRLRRKPTHRRSLGRSALVCINPLAYDRFPVVSRFPMNFPATTTMDRSSSSFSCPSQPMAVPSLWTSRPGHSLPPLWVACSDARRPSARAAAPSPATGSSSCCCVRRRPPRGQPERARPTSGPRGPVPSAPPCRPRPEPLLATGAPSRIPSLLLQGHGHVHVEDDAR